ncbi:hypothetical protein N2152v2_009206 [Parachlorella kessleri]
MFTSTATRQPSLAAKAGFSQPWWILLAAAFLSSYVLGAPSDGELLLAFKASLANGDTILTGDLQFTGLQGSLPAPALPATLETLFLSGNSLTGSIPDDWSQLSSLQVLWLDNNQFVGGIPEQFPPSLQEVVLDFNQLDAPLPSNLSQLSALRTLSVQGNSLQGPLSTHLPDSLQQLLLNDNDLTGTVPSGTWPTSLQLLYLAGNHLTGSVPTSLPPSLTELYLGRNQLRSGLPRNWSLPASLTNLDLGRSLVDTDMDAVRALQLPTGFSALWLDGNNITGTLSSAWALPSTRLDMSNNDLTGSLPADWSLPSGLDFYLTNNSLSGPLPNQSSWVNVKITVAPGNEGICGQVPSTPEYQVATSRVNTAQLENNLAACPPGTLYPVSSPSPVAAPPPSGGGGSSSAATIGGAVGGAVGAVLLGLAGFLYYRRRKRRQRVQHKPQESQGMDGKDSLDYDVESTLGTNSYSIKRMRSSPNSVLTPDPIVPSALMANDPLLSSIVSQLNTQPNTQPSISSAESGLSANSGRASSRTSQRTEVDMQNWNVSFEDLRLNRKIGEGSFGKVYLASWRTTQVAVKLLAGSDAMNKSNPSEAAAMVLSADNPVLVTLRAECSKMAALRHPNVLGFLAICEKPPCVVSEFCERGSLHDILRAARTSPELCKELSWERRLKMAADAAEGMAYLHTRNPPLVHRDLKSPNLLVTQHWDVKIADFNLSKFIEEPGTAVASSLPSVTNPRWLAPEVLSGQKPTLASDVFSFGVVMWEMLTWATPWETIMNPWAVSGLVTEGKRLQVPEPAKLPGHGGNFVGLGDYIDLMHKCWAQAPEDRPTFDEVLAELRDLCDGVLAEAIYKEEAPASEPAPDLVGLREWLSPIMTKSTNLSTNLSSRRGSANVSGGNVSAGNASTGNVSGNL